MHKALISLAFSILVSSCGDPPTVESIEMSSKAESALTDTVSELEKFILSKDLADHLLYVMQRVDSLPRWNFPIIYALTFYGDTIEISVQKSPILVKGAANHGIIGYYSYGQNTIQIIDHYDSVKVQEYYDYSALKELNDTVVASYLYENGGKHNHIDDLNLTMQLSYLKLKRINERLSVLEEHLPRKSTKR